MDAFGRKLLMVVCAAGVLLLVPASAFAGGQNRFASPNGMGGEPCNDQMNPCSIETAVNGSSATDIVFLAGGTYTTSTELNPAINVSIQGTTGARPQINTTAPTGINITNARLSDVVVVQTSGNYGVSSDGGAVIERVSSHSAGFYSPCTLGPNDLMRDSVCWFTGGDTPNDTAALKVFPPFAGGGMTTVRNVTAVSSGASAGILGIRFSGSSTVNATNVIAVSGSGPDVRTFQYPGFTGTQSISLDYSNYDSELEATAGEITNPGTGTNQMTPPAFVNAAMGDFHQTASSTGTLDLGTATGATGLLDFDGQARNQGAAPDIGADEFVPQTTPPPTGGGTTSLTPLTPVAPGTPTAPAAKKKCKKRKRPGAAAARKCKKKRAA